MRRLPTVLLLLLLLALPAYQQALAQSAGDSSVQAREQTAMKPKHEYAVALPKVAGPRLHRRQDPRA